MTECISESTPLFGGYAREFGPVVETVLERSSNFQHYFTSEESFGAILADGSATANANRICALEMLQNSHLAALLCLSRSKQWLLACWNSYQRGDLLAWCNDLRSLIESTADFYSDLNLLAISLAESAPQIRGALAGECATLLTFSEFEDKITHFMHARKLNGVERAQLSNVFEAKKTFEYVKDLERFGLEGVYSFYSELSQFAHPAANSLHHFYKQAPDGGWMVVNTGGSGTINALAEKYRGIINRFSAYAFMPGLLLIRVLVPFHIFPKHPELKKFPFELNPSWPRIQKALKK
ncbi:hypothetical protein [Sphingobium sp. Z007]|uniref:hypothetical protein n=1 Tax=Sphingobium sp. Z007 TaxID=627495 RepID=UPI001124E783|nr:hypothetical protein [Sphingobium sp. Z007]